MRSVRPASARRREGFTLLELMIVVAIIGITAAIAAPAIGRALASSRADRATHDIIRIARRGRAEAIAYGRAYLLRMTTTGTGGVQLWRGQTSLCRQSWATITTAGNCVPPAAPDGNCVDYVDSTQYAAAPWVLQIDQMQSPSSPTAVPLMEMCLPPTGEMVVRTNGSAGAFASPPTGMVTIAVRLSSPDGADPVRGAIFPSSGSPRTVR